MNVHQSFATLQTRVILMQKLLFKRTRTALKHFQKLEYCSPCCRAASDRDDEKHCDCDLDHHDVCSVKLSVDGLDVVYLWLCREFESLWLTIVCNALDIADRVRGMKSCRKFPPKCYSHPRPTAVNCPINLRLYILELYCFAAIPWCVLHKFSVSGRYDSYQWCNHGCAQSEDGEPCETKPVLVSSVNA